MNMLHWSVRRYLAEESGSGDGASSGAPAGSESTDDGGSVDWEGLNDGVEAGSDDFIEDDDAGAAPSPSPSATPAPTPSPSATQTTTGKKEDPVVEVPGETKVEATPVEPGEPALTAEEQAAAQTKLTEDFAKWKQGRMTELTTAYAVSEEDSTRLLTEPEAVLPKIAAQLHMQIMEDTLAAVQRMIPHMVPQVVQGTNREKEARALFFAKNPDLVKHEKEVMTMGKVFRQMNPKAGPEEAAEKIGNLVRSSMGLTPAPAAGPAPAPSSNRRTPHRPVQTGSGVKAPTGAKPAEEFWSEMASDD
jgi:hypothetical protein